MHVGITYPYHWDLWALTSQFHPGWIPRRACMRTGLSWPPGYSAFAGLDVCSKVGVVSANREKVTYEFGFVALLSIALLEVETVTVLGVKSTLYTLTLTPATLMDMVATDAYSAPKRTFGATHLQSIFYSGTPHFPPLEVGAEIYPMPWAPQSPPSDRHLLGDWIKNGPPQP